jgi:hypothetical protein
LDASEKKLGEEAMKFKASSASVMSEQSIYEGVNLEGTAIERAPFRFFQVNHGALIAEIVVGITIAGAVAKMGEK